MRYCSFKCLTMCALFSEELSYPERFQDPGEIHLGEVQQVDITGM
jgi:hypothetical protein